MYGSGVFYSGIGYAIGTVLSELFLLSVYEQLGIISIYQVCSLYTANINKIYINPMKISSFLCALFYKKSLILGLYAIIGVINMKIFIALIS